MNNNIFAQNARIAATMTTTENGHAAASTTGSAVLDLYGQVGALRGQDKIRILNLLEKAFKDDLLLATRTVFYARDCRGGTGERELFRFAICWMAQNYTDILRKNLHWIPFYGRWDDLYALVGTKLENDAFAMMRGQLLDDIRGMEKGEPISLLAKWLKSCNASSEETRKLGRITRKKLHFANEKVYRRTLAKLRKYIDIVEAKMSSGKWGKIEYDKVPSRAGMIYREAFKKHDEFRYAEYLEAVKKGEKKINTAMNTPQDLVHAYGACAWGSHELHRKQDDPTIELMWKNLPDYVDSDENVLCMVDVSGSMNGRPIEVSTGLGMYFAQKNRGAFHNLFMTFESVPKFVSLTEGASLRENLCEILESDWGGSTDLNQACKELLRFAIENNAPQADMPTRLLIISDMEIDNACRIYHRWGMSRTGDLSSILFIDELREMYRKAGYKMPQVIFWNVESRDNHFHTKSDVPGTMLASGSSPAVFKAVMAMEDLEVTPYDAMVEVLNGERYSRVTV
jgi:hypothetical protein